MKAIYPTVSKNNNTVCTAGDTLMNWTQARRHSGRFNLTGGTRQYSLSGDLSMVSVCFCCSLLWHDNWITPYNAYLSSFWFCYLNNLSRLPSPIPLLLSSRNLTVCQTIMSISMAHSAVYTRVLDLQRPDPDPVGHKLMIYSPMTSRAIGSVWGHHFDDFNISIGRHVIYDSAIAVSMKICWLCQLCHKTVSKLNYMKPRWVIKERMLSCTFVVF